MSRVLCPRQRCPSCHGERTTDWFGMCEPLECSMCDGTGFDPRLPPVLYVRPDDMYSLHSHEEFELL